jgi:hypothetical protein
MPFKKPVDHTTKFKHPKSPPKTKALLTKTTRKVNPPVHDADPNKKRPNKRVVPAVFPHPRNDKRADVKKASGRRNGDGAVTGVGVVH